MLLYLETSIPNFLFHTDSPEKRSATEDLFELILQGRYEACVSDLYLDEILDVPSPLLRYQLSGVPRIYGLDILEVSKACYNLADAYVGEKAFTQKNYYDALHVATAVQSGRDATP